MTAQQTSRTNTTEALRRLRKVYDNDEGAPEVFEAVRVLLAASCEHPESYYWCSGCGFAAEPSEPTGFDLRSNDVRPPRSDAVSRKHDNHDGCSPYDPEHVAAKAGDAVTAQPNPSDSASPDEPIFDLNLREQEWRRRYHAGELSFAEVLREARAASASVPPLHTDDAGSPLGSTTEGTSFGPKPAGDVSGELGLRDASLASAIVTESVTSTVPPLDVERR